MIQIVIGMTKADCIFIFNSMIRGTPVSFTDKILPLISEYLTEINYEKSGEMINLLSQHPNLASSAMPKVIEYFERKYCIFSIIYNNKTILYYE